MGRGHHRFFWIARLGPRSPNVHGDGFLGNTNELYHIRPNIHDLRPGFHDLRALREATYPTADQVLSGVTFGPTDNLTGTVVLPTASQVISTAKFGDSSGTAGTVVLPPCEPGRGRGHVRARR